MQFSRRSLFSFALAAPAAAAAVPPKPTEPPITMRPTPECCERVMLSLGRLDSFHASQHVNDVELKPLETLFECTRCRRRAIVPDVVLENRSVGPRPPAPPAPEPEMRFTWRGMDRSGEYTSTATRLQMLETSHAMGRSARKAQDELAAAIFSNGRA